MHQLLLQVWREAEVRQHWLVGRYVVMPDHVHFFCAPLLQAQPLPVFVGRWKEWTSKLASRQLGIAPPLWQREFFDHLLRSAESYSEKWDYVRENPVRASLVTRPEDWIFQGELNDLRVA